MPGCLKAISEDKAHNKKGCLKGQPQVGLFFYTKAFLQQTGHNELNAGDQITHMPKYALNYLVIKTNGKEIGGVMAAFPQAYAAFLVDIFLIIALFFCQAFCSS